MTLLFYVLVALGLAIWLGLLYQNDPGYLLIARGDWTLETTLVLALVVLLLAFGLLYFLIRGGLTLWRLRGNLRRWRRGKAQAQARRATRRGLTALIEGNWEQAEKELARGARDDDFRLFNYLMAAQAAQQQGAEGRRDEYLTLAHKCGAEGALAVGLTQAQIQLEQGQLEQALAALSHLRGLAPKRASVLLLLARLHERLGSWVELRESAAALRKLKSHEAEADRLERRAIAELLEGAAGAGRPERLRELWAELPKGLRGEPGLIAPYARGLITLGYGAEAEPLLREALKRQWEPALVRLYGLAEGEDPVRQLAQAEGWATEHERDRDLLLTLARIAARQQLWGKARAYLEASVGIAPDPEALRELGELLERLGEPEAARECFYRALTRETPRARALPGAIALP